MYVIETVEHLYANEIAWSVLLQVPIWLNSALNPANWDGKLYQLENENVYFPTPLYWRITFIHTPQRPFLNFSYNNHHHL